MVKKKMTLEEKLEEAIITDAPYKVPDNWTWTNLSKLLSTLETGKRPKGGVSGIENGIPSLGGEHLNYNGGFNFDKLKFVPNEFADTLKKGLIEQDDILIVKDGATTGKCSYVDINFPFDKAVINEHVFKCRTVNEINSRFIFWFIVSPLGQQFVKLNLKGSAQGGINTKFIENFSVCVPPLKEQQRIVDKIESLFEKLDKAKELIEEARDDFEKRKSAILEKAFRGKLTTNFKKILTDNKFDIELNELEKELVEKIKVEWKFCTIKDIANVKGGKRLPKGEKLVVENTGYPYLRAGNLKNNSVLEDDIQYLTKDIQNMIKNYTISSEDVYITIVGACIGDVGIIPKKLSGANLTENAAKICNINKDIIDQTFLMKWLSSPTGQFLIRGNILSATLGKLALTRIKDILVPVPSIEEQKEIVRILDKVLEEESKIEELTKLQEQIELIKKSILAKAFRGQLGTNCEEDESALELLKEILNT